MPGTPEALVETAAPQGGMPRTPEDLVETAAPQEGIPRTPEDLVESTAPQGGIPRTPEDLAGMPRTPEDLFALAGIPSTPVEAFRPRPPPLAAAAARRPHEQHSGPQPYAEASPEELDAIKKAREFLVGPEAPLGQPATAAAAVAAAAAAAATGAEAPGQPCLAAADARGCAPAALRQPPPALEPTPRAPKTPPRHAPADAAPRDTAPQTTQRNQLEISHYSAMREKADRFARFGDDSSPRHVRTIVGSSIYRPGQKAENVYGCSITAGSRVAQEIQVSRGLGRTHSGGFLHGAKIGELGPDGLLAPAGSRRLLAGAGQGQQILYSPTSGLLG
ncbi:unnamed protein product [Prorocentrum cordatum]|uniref:Poly [ADP-ribose] polymerase n=1 Tax=Prorocentrum cordatum TaxID=2364126 RepID=A0ABN9S2M6_9DINO|nr:unnamed protein product [Polarella glacialis]